MINRYDKEEKLNSPENPQPDINNAVLGNPEISKDDNTQPVEHLERSDSKIDQTKAENKKNKATLKESMNKPICFIIQFLKNIKKIRPVKSGNEGEPPVSQNPDKRNFRITHFLEKHHLSPQFIMSGIFLVISVAIYFVCVSPLKKRNMQLNNELNTRAEKLEQYLKKGRNIYSPNMIKAKEQEIDLIKDELKVCKETLSIRDQMIEVDFADTNGNQIHDEALWKTHYTKRCNDLMGFLEHNGFDTRLSDLGFIEWKQDVPSKEEIVSEQKKFWIQNELINILVGNRESISDFHYLRFVNSPQLANNISHKLFTPISFKFELEMDQSKLLYLISDILNSELNLFIETVNLEYRTKQIQEPKELSDTIYRVSISAYAMDFSNDA